MQRLSSYFAAAFTSAILAASPALGTMLTASASSDDAEPTDDRSATGGEPDGTGDLVQSKSKGSFRAGSFPNQDPRNAVYVFDLPNRPAGEPVITDAEFSLNYEFENFDAGDGTFNADLYGLRVSDPSDGDTSDDQVLVSDYGAGETPNGPATQMELADEFISRTGTSAGRVSTDDVTGASDALASFLNANYVDGGRTFIRLNPDVVDPIDFDDDKATGYQVSSQDNTTASQRPQLTLTTAVPEPGSLALVGVGGVLMLSRKRRRV